MLEAVLIYSALACTFGWDLKRLPSGWLDNLLAAIDRRLGTVGFSMLLALAMLGLALLCARLDLDCRYLGGWYARMAADPFDWEAISEVGFRRLTPTISYLIGLRGENIIFTNLAIAGTLLFCVAKYFVSHSRCLSDAFFATAAFAVSMVTLTTIHCGGYTDSTTYLIVFLMWRFRHRTWLFYFLFLLGLLNREAIVFLVPWFAVLRFKPGRPIWAWLADIGLGLGLALGAYVVFREFIAAQTEVRYSLEYYLGNFLDDPLSRFRQTLYYHGLGTFSVFKLLWVFPILAFTAFWKENRRTDMIALILLICGAYVQLLFASDTSRLMTMAFIVMPISLSHLFESNQFGIRKWIGWVFLANLAIPTVYTAQTTIEIWQPLWRHLLITWLN